MKTDNEYLKDSIASIQDRKLRMSERVEVLTKDFVNRATTLAGELDETKDEV